MKVWRGVSRPLAAQETAGPGVTQFADETAPVPFVWRVSGSNHPWGEEGSNQRRLWLRDNDSRLARNRHHRERLGPLALFNGPRLNSTPNGGAGYFFFKHRLTQCRVILSYKDI